MKVAFNVKDFVEKNDKEVRKILAFVVRRVDPDLLEDLAQNFYLVMIRNKILDKFDKEITSHVGHFFARFIYKAIENSVYGYMGDRRLVGDARWCTVMLSHENNEVLDIFEVLNPQAAENGLRGNHKYQGTVVDGRYNHSAIRNEFHEENFMAMFEAFEKEIKGSSELSDRTRELYHRYLMSSKAGVRPYNFSQEEKITPTYVTNIRHALRERFREFRERYEEGGGLETCN